MKPLEDFKKTIGVRKTKDITEEGISATEKFQRVFFSTFENIQKIPHNIKEIFLSNIMYRTFSHQIHQTIDEKSTSFYKEKVKIQTGKYSIFSYKDTVIILDPTIIKRSKAIGITARNEESSGPYNVHVRPLLGQNADDLFFFHVPPQGTVFFQFEYSFSKCYLVVRSQQNDGTLMLEINYVPL